MILKSPWLFLAVLGLLVARCTTEGPKDVSLRSARETRTPILIDGNLHDWQGRPPMMIRLRPDSTLRALWVANDDRFLFLALETEREIRIQGANRLALYLDTDDNPKTGKPVHGLGAEFEWRFGDQSGFLYLGEEPQPITHGDLGLVAAPATMSRFFEAAFDLKSLSAGQNRHLGPSLKLVMEKQTLGNLPEDATGLLTYRLDEDPVLQKQEWRIEPVSRAGLIRLVTYNIEKDGLFEQEQRDALTRILRVIQPEILNIQGGYKHDADQVRDALDVMLPSPAGKSWHVRKQNPGLIVASQFPIQKSFFIAAFDFGAARAFLIDTKDGLGHNLLLISTHLACCNQDTSDWQRQLICDAVMAFIRDAKSTGGILDRQGWTPIVIAGDMHFVGSADQLRTLRTGAILNRERFGPGSSPDWDHSPFSVAEPRVTGLPMTFTWTKRASKITPTRLDYILYSDSMLRVENQFVFFTPTLDRATRQKYGLNMDDSLSASDHLPVVVDLAKTLP